MDVAIIGAGNVGSALAASSVSAGHTVTLSSRDYENAQAAASEAGERSGRISRPSRRRRR